ncbi:MAG TPA: metallophosphoesterase [Oligoflexia bacterium]|nr:metallophosphoesterase [Oligoflexia bacterium]
MRNEFSRSGIARSIFTFFILFTAKPSSAELLQIIHTNDLHSHFESYPALKATIDRIKNDAGSQGIETLVLDAGDFSEGTQFYLADRGEQSWRAMSELGYDAVTIGNHDYLLGLKDLNRVIKNVKPSHYLLGANFRVGKSYPDLKKALTSRARFERGGKHISVIGLTTDEFMYTWRAGKKVISSPIQAAQVLVPKYRRDSQFVIALSHLGIEEDLKLVRNTRGIDLVIGGHSHTKLSRPYHQTDLDHKLVPIVQAGDHGKYVGDLLVDLVPGKPLRIVRYELHPVSLHGPRDSGLERFLADAREKLKAMYPPNWLSQPIGFSEVPLEVPGRGQRTAWSEILGRGMMRVTKADLAFNASDLYGTSVPAGIVTREKLIQYYPRVFEFYNHTTGWNVWTLEVEGWILKPFLENVIRQGFRVTTTNVTFDVSGAKGKESISNFRVGNSEVAWYKTYKVAVPEGIGRVIAGDWYNSRLLQPVQSSKVPIWAAMEIQLSKQGGVVRAYD